MPVLPLPETPPAQSQGFDNRCRNRSQLKTKKGMQLCRAFSIDRNCGAQIAQNRAFACPIEKLTPRRSRIRFLMFAPPRAPIANCAPELSQSPLACAREAGRGDSQKRRDCMKKRIVFPGPGSEGDPPSPDW